MDSAIDRRFKRAWHFFTDNAAALVIATLLVCLGGALVIPGPWMALNLLGEISQSFRTGRPVRWQATYERLSTFLPAWGLVFTMGLGIAFGLALCVLPGALLAIAWFHAPVMVAEGKPVFEALGESYQLLRRQKDWLGTLLDGLLLLAFGLAASLVAVVTVVALPLALAYLALCTLEATEPPAASDAIVPA